jgi:hypothetical protein
MSGRLLPGPPGFGCAKVGWLPKTSAAAVSSAIARDAGIARRALLGLSKSIRNPDPAIRRKLGTRAAGVNARAIMLAGAMMQQEPADCGTSEAA